MGRGNWSESEDSILSQNEALVAVGNATGALDLSGLSQTQPNRIWFYAILQGTLRFLAQGNSTTISDGSSSAKWYELNLTHTQPSIPVEFAGTSLLLQSFFIERTLGSISNNGAGANYRVSNYSSNDISVELSDQGTSFLTLRDSYDSGWLAQSGSVILLHTVSSLGFNVFIVQVRSTPANIQVSYAGQARRIVVFTLFVVYVLSGIVWMIVSKRNMARKKSGIPSQKETRILQPISRMKRSQQLKDRSFPALSCLRTRISSLTQ
jgi:hypothetical protein